MLHRSCLQSVMVSLDNAADARRLYIKVAEHDRTKIVLQGDVKVFTLTGMHSHLSLRR